MSLEQCCIICDSLLAISYGTLERHGAFELRAVEPFDWQGSLGWWKIRVRTAISACGFEELGGVLSEKGIGGLVL